MISKLILKFLPFGVCILDIFLTRHRYSLYNKEKGRRLKTEHVYRRMCRKELLLNCSPWEGVSGRLVLGLVWEHGFQKSSYLFHLREVAHCTQAGHCGAAQAPGPPLEAWSSWTPERGRLHDRPSVRALALQPKFCRFTAAGLSACSVTHWVSLLEAGAWLPQLCPVDLFPLLCLFGTLHCKCNCMLTS